MAPWTSLYLGPWSQICTILAIMWKPSFISFSLLSFLGIENGEVTVVPLEVGADDEMTVVPLDDTGQLGIDGIVDGEDGEKLVRVWTHEMPKQDTSNDVDDKVSKEELYAGLTEGTFLCSIRIVWRDELPKTLLANYPTTLQ